MWLSLVERSVRDAEVASSNLVTPILPLFILIIHYRIRSLQVSLPRRFIPIDSFSRHPEEVEPPVAIFRPGKTRLRALAAMIAAAFLLSLKGVFTKLASLHRIGTPHIPASEIALFRYIVGVLSLLALARVTSTNTLTGGLLILAGAIVLSLQPHQPARPVAAQRSIRNTRWFMLSQM